MSHRIASKMTETIEKSATADYVFQLRNIVKTYSQGDPPAVQIESLDIPGCQVVALIGVSGSGKTTLMNILGLLDQAEPGSASSILFNNREILGLDEADTRRERSNFGFVFQQGYLLENVPGRENIRIPPCLKGFDPQEADLDRMLRSVDLGPEEGDRRPSNLSAGQRQRTAVLRALSHGPSVVFADEPTSSLDKKNAEGVLRILREWCKRDPNRTVLLVTHDTAHAVEYADSAILMAHGRVCPPFALSGMSPEQLSRELYQFTQTVRQTASGSSPELGVVEPAHPRSARPGLTMLRVAWRMAWHDIFQRQAPDSGTSWFRRLFPVRVLQSHGIASLALALLLALFFARLFFALSGYLVHSVSDPRMNQIRVLRHKVGGRGLDQEDLRLLSGLAWVDGKIQVPTPEKKAGARQVITMASPARPVQIGTELTNCAYPSSCSYTLLGVSVPVNDRLMAKLPVLEGQDVGHLKESERSVRSLFLKPDSGVAPGTDPELIPDSALDPAKLGIVVTPRALKALGYSRIPAALNVTLSSRDEGQTRMIPLLGLASELPADKEALILERLFEKEYFRGGIGSLPDYSQISLYVVDLLRDGLPLCDALDGMDYGITEGQRGQLAWVIRLIVFIRIFALVASAGLLIVVLGQLTKSFWEAIRRKEKEIGVLLAYGIRARHLYLTFWLEVAVIWAAAALCAVLLDLTVVSRVVALAYRGVPNSGPITSVPLWLWTAIVMGSLVIATLSVVPALRSVDARRVANMLKAVN